MGIIKNLIKFKSIENLNENYSIGYYRKGGDKALLYNGEVFEPYISSVSDNVTSKENSVQNEGFFLVKKKDGAYMMVDENSNVIFSSLKDGVSKGVLKKETYALDVSLSDYNESKININQYILTTEKGEVLIIPQTGFVSEIYKHIGAIDEKGRRRVFETDFSARNNKGFCNNTSWRSNDSGWYIDVKGLKITPKILNERTYGDYKVLFLAEPNNGAMEYICDKDFNKLSKGVYSISISHGRFFARDEDRNLYLIDEKGNRKSANLKDYYVLDGGMVVCEAIDKNSAVVYDKNDNVVCEIKNYIVDEYAGVISGIDCGDERQRCFMFGLNHEKGFLVDENCAKIMISILKWEEPSIHETIEMLKETSEEAIEQAICCYELILKENLSINPDSLYLKRKLQSARKDFYKEMKAASIQASEMACHELRAIDKMKSKLLKDSKMFKQKEADMSKIVEDLEQQ